MTPHKFSIQELTARLEGVAGEIAGIMAKHEVDILDLGSRLRDLAGQSDFLYRRGSELAQMSSGEEMASATEELSNKFEEMTGVCRLDLSEESRAQLKKTLESVKGLDNYMDSFRRIVRNLRMLGISTRIESARLGSLGRGFVTLADDVEKLAGSIVTHSTRISDNSRELVNLVSEALEQASNIINEQKLCFEELFDDIRANISSLEELSDKSALLSQGLPGRMKDITNDIGEVVSFMQFHDIIRQQVEHVEEAIRDIVAEARERGETGLGEGDDLMIAGWIHDVCELQASQLENGRIRFHEAIERIRELLNDIAGMVEDLCDSIRKAVGSGNEAGGTVLDNIEKGLDKALESIKFFAEQGESMSGIVRSVAGTVQDMSSFVTDIEEVGSEIELISLNASIKTAHTGEQGRALGVLASSIQRLSVDARSQTELVSGELTSISDASDSLISNADKTAGAAEVGELVAGLEEMMKNVKGLNQRSHEIFGELLSLGRDLAGDIRGIAREATFHAKASQEMTAIRMKLDSLVQELGHMVPPGTEKARSERLRKMLERYTMEAERVIHKNVLGDEHPGEGTELFGSAEASEFGDNVELF